jgi:hypothetical protein
MDKLNWQPWGLSELNRNLDGFNWGILKEMKFSKNIISCRELNGFIIDIKTEVNISDINRFKYDNEFGLEYIKSLNIGYDKIKHLLIIKKR